MEISCEDVRKNIDEYAQHRLEEPLKERIGWHVYVCTECLLHYVVATSRDLEKQEVPLGS